MPVDLSSDESDHGGRRLVQRAHEGKSIRSAEIAPPRLADPVRIRVLERGLLRSRLGKRVEERPDAVGDSAEHGVRERNGSLQARTPDELDRLVDGCIAGNTVDVSELVRTEAQRRSHGWIEARHAPPPERLDRVVERPCALNRAVRESMRERAVSLVEAGGSGAERTIGVRAVLEDAQQHVERRRTRRAYDRRPRSHASYAMRRPPSG